MKQILILGAGKSSSYLIQYLIERRNELDIHVVILDINTDSIQRYENLTRVKIIKLQTGDINEYEKYIMESFLAISMLPAYMHIEVAKYCIEHQTHLLTPSYISEEMKALSSEVRAKNLIFLNELGFDPGIDHMTTMKICQTILEEGGVLKSYRSYAGGLVAPHCDTNPWRYKFSWNPRNVILAGQGGDIKFLRNNELVSLTYRELFSKSECLELSNGEKFDAYANRDSLKYENIYGWNNLETLLRGTMRMSGFCSAWAVLVGLGITDDSRKNLEYIGKSYAEFYASFIQMKNEDFLESVSADVREKLISIGFLDSDSKIKRNGSAAEIFESILVHKWKLEPQDTDRVVMVHFFEYEKAGQRYEIESYLSLEGEDNHYTAMAKTVGLPIALAAEMIIMNKYTTYGVSLPIHADLYLPILSKLADLGIVFKETIREK